VRTSWHSLLLIQNVRPDPWNGGFRKVQVARKGMGKSGGARVVYIWRNERFPVFLITVFPKDGKICRWQSARAKKTGRQYHEWGQAEATFDNGKKAGGEYLTARQRQTDGSWKIFRNMVIPEI
jgi:hypothetical protein